MLLGCRVVSAGTVVWDYAKIGWSVSVPVKFGGTCYLFVDGESGYSRSEIYNLLVSRQFSRVAGLATDRLTPSNGYCNRAVASSPVGVYLNSSECSAFFVFISTPSDYYDTGFYISPMITKTKTSSGVNFNFGNYEDEINNCSWIYAIDEDPRCYTPNGTGIFAADPIWQWVKGLGITQSEINSVSEQTFENAFVMGVDFRKQCTFDVKIAKLERKGNLLYLYIVSKSYENGVLVVDRYPRCMPFLMGTKDLSTGFRDISKYLDPHVLIPPKKWWWPSNETMLATEESPWVIVIDLDYVEERFFKVEYRLGEPI